jgi:hypothetical protein
MNFNVRARNKVAIYVLNLFDDNLTIGRHGKESPELPGVI